MNEEMLLLEYEEPVGTLEEPEVELIDEPDVFDLDKGDLYEDLWYWHKRERPSFEVLGTVAGVQKGSISFTLPENMNDINVFNYFVETVDGSGSRQSRNYPSIDALATYLNNGTHPRIFKDGNKVYFEFPKGIQASATTGVTRIGLVYRPKDGWDYHYVDPVATNGLFPIDCTDNNYSIEVLVMTQDKHLASGVFRRDLPVVNPNDYKQYLFSGTGLYEMELRDRTALYINKLKAGEGKINQVWLRFIK